MIVHVLLLLGILRAPQCGPPEKGVSCYRITGGSPHQLALNSPYVKAVYAVNNSCQLPVFESPPRPGIVGVGHTDAEIWNAVNPRKCRKAQRLKKDRDWQVDAHRQGNLWMVTIADRIANDTLEFRVVLQ
jgi:hypothetical protein